MTNKTFYLIRVADTNRYSFGSTNNIGAKMVAMKAVVELPVSLELTQPDTGVDMEHIRFVFEKKRFLGNWYAMSDQDITTLKKILAGEK